MRIVLVAVMVIGLSACGSTRAAAPATSTATLPSASPASPVSAQERCDGPAPGGAGTQAQQDAVVALAEKVQAVADTSEGPGGLAGLYVTGDTDAVDVFWVGPPPAALTALASASGPARLVVHPATYTQAQMQTAVAKAIRFAEDGLSASESGPCVTGAGIRVEVTTDSDGSPPASIPDSFRAHLQAMVGSVPVVELAPGSRAVAA